MGAEGESVTGLIYRYEEPVFDPRQGSARNLAAMIAAQVAVNYGLFCRRIQFRGPFDAHDRRLILQAVETTAREIYVTRFLRPNPFLVGPARDMEPRLLPSYSQAAIEFEGEDPDPEDGGNWVMDGGRHAVLSSGGKESLLTFGLLSELGVEAHPLFVNESGRHWFTALNGYRHMREGYPLTCRVWTNADRIFAWMLRRLPFIRPDFNRMRSDEYPIRQWTMAVFLFGALPLLRLRGIGRLLVGCESDTTRSAVFAGIPFHDGLYDQSLHFDRRLTAYFSQKGWKVEQLSLLRNLSELMVEKILAERYPALLRSQVSCHAAHIVNGRVLPCGRCEKCRRIVSLLVAAGADPASCGYDEEQVGQCLQALDGTELRQEEGDERALRGLLAARGALFAPDGDLPSADEAARLLYSIRFNPERAPKNLIPEDLRAGLHRIFQLYAFYASRGSRPSEPRPDRSRNSSPPWIRRQSRAGGRIAGASVWSRPRSA